MLAWYQELIRLRKIIPDLARERQSEMAVQCGLDWLTIRRGDVLIVCNLAPEAQQIKVTGAFHVLAASDAAAHVKSDAVFAPAESATLLERVKNR